MSGQHDTVPLDDHRGEIEARLADAAGLLLSTDFDGTLAPIVDDPDSAAITPANDAALHALAAHDRVRVAVVSGRALDDVRERVGIDGLTYSGNHGLELLHDGELTVHPEAADSEETLARVLAEIDERTGDTEGYSIENKGLTATIHYRGLEDEAVSDIDEAIEAVLAEYDDELEASSGKEIIEIEPAIPWDKGRIITRLSDDAPAEWISAYLGDDTTDETAFRALGDDGISVFVGSETDTAARYRLNDPEAVSRFLEWLLDEGIEALGEEVNENR